MKMRFKNNILGYLKLGIVFVLFAFIISMVFLVVITSLMLVPFGIGVMFGDGSNTAGIGLNITFGIGFSILMMILSFVVIGWAIFYFYRKNIFILKK